MNRLFQAMAGLALLAALVVLTGPAGAQGDKAPTIKDVMQRLHKGANPPIAMLKKQLQADQPDWDTIHRTTKDFVILGAALAKNTPPRGDKESWTRRAQDYFTTAKAMDEAAQKKDQKGALALRDKLAGSCMNCHQAHKKQ
jgi:hypothetical protein